MPLATGYHSSRWAALYLSCPWSARPAMTARATTIELAETLLEQRHVAVTRFLFRRAESRGADPDRCAGGRWIAAMLAGDFNAAWCESDAIRRRGRPDP